MSNFSQEKTKFELLQTDGVEVKNKNGYQTNSFAGSVLNDLIAIAQQVHEGSLNFQQFTPEI
jgi:hypothetical protein